MRELVAFLIFYGSIKIGGGGVFFTSLSLVVSLLSILYLALAITERTMKIGDSFRINPGVPTPMPPMDDEDSDIRPMKTGVPPDSTRRN